MEQLLTLASNHSAQRTAQHHTRRSVHTQAFAGGRGRQGRLLACVAAHMAAAAAQRAALISSPSAGPPAAPAPQRRGSSASGSAESGRLGRTRAAMSAAAAMGAVKLPTLTPPTPSEASWDASWMHAGCGRRLHTSILLLDLVSHVRPCPVLQHHVCTRSHGAALPLNTPLVLCIGCLQPAVAFYNLRPGGALLPPPPRSGAASCGAGRAVPGATTLAALLVRATAVYTGLCVWARAHGARVHSSRGC